MWTSQNGSDIISLGEYSMHICNKTIPTILRYMLMEHNCPNLDNGNNGTQNPHLCSYQLYQLSYNYPYCVHPMLLIQTSLKYSCPAVLLNCPDGSWLVLDVICQLVDTSPWAGLLLNTSSLSKSPKKITVQNKNSICWLI